MAFHQISQSQPGQAQDGLRLSQTTLGPSAASLGEGHGSQRDRDGVAWLLFRAVRRRHLLAAA